ncbi:unnamed protein product, partial [Iphiclides podalirius]
MRTELNTETACTKHESLESSSNFAAVNRRANVSNYGDLYIVGRIWLLALKTALLGYSLNMIPVVNAEAPPPPPKKPPPMKYKELPLYKSPHSEYKEYIEEKYKCPDADVKLMRRLLLPYVTLCRKQVQESACRVARATKETCQGMRASVNESKRDFKAFMRDSENATIRKAVVGLGAAVGYLLGSGRGIPRRIFSTAAGAAAGGALCYPKETDEAFRSFTYYSGKTALGLFNWTCGKDFGWRERIPCKDDLPVASGKIVPQCSPKK